MKYRLVVAIILGVVFGSLGFPQTVRTWVSSSGLDTNACSRTAPCRNFGAAITAVASGGEVVALDSGGYGAFIVDKPVSIVAPLGVHAAIAPTAGNAISINEAISGSVLIRNLYLNSRGAGTGIYHFGRDDLFVENCEIVGFADHGIYLFPQDNGLYASVSGCTIRKSQTGIHLFGAGASAVLVDRSRLEDHGFAGILSHGRGKFTVRNTVVGSCTSGFMVISGLFGGSASMDLFDSTAVACENGFEIISGSADPIRMNLEHCVASRNTKGLSAIVEGAVGSAVMRVSNSSITNNWTGALAMNGGVIESRGNNTLENNEGDNTFVSFYSAK